MGPSELSPTRLPARFFAVHSRIPWSIRGAAGLLALGAVLTPPLIFGDRAGPSVPLALFLVFQLLPAALLMAGRARAQAAVVGMIWLAGGLLALIEYAGGGSGVGRATLFLGVGVSIYGALVVAALALPGLGPIPRTGRRALVATLVAALGLCVALTWYRPATHRVQELVDERTGWTGIEGYLDLGFGVDAPIDGFTIVDQRGMYYFEATDRDHWLRVTLPPGRYDLFVGASCRTFVMSGSLQVESGHHIELDRAAHARPLSPGCIPL